MLFRKGILASWSSMFLITTHSAINNILLSNNSNTMSVPTKLTNDQIVHDVICKRFMFSLNEIEDILAGILDPATIEHNTIIRFVASLPYIKPADLGPASEDQNCSICLNKYGKKFHLEKDSPTMLPCRHIFGSDCLKLWLKDHESCPLCRRTVFLRPVASGHLNNPRLEQLARDFLFYLKTYLETLQYKPYGDNSYGGFVLWAQGFGPVCGGWNRYRDGWSGHALWIEYDYFRIFCRSQALSLVYQIRDLFEAHWAP